MPAPPGTRRRSASALGGSPCCRGGGGTARAAADVSPAAIILTPLAEAGEGAGAATTRLRTSTAARLISVLDLPRGPGRAAPGSTRGAARRPRHGGVGRPADGPRAPRHGCRPVDPRQRAQEVEGQHVLRRRRRFPPPKSAAVRGGAAANYARVRVRRRRQRRRPLRVHQTAPPTSPHLLTFQREKRRGEERDGEEEEDLALTQTDQKDLWVAILEREKKEREESEEHGSDTNVLSKIRCLIIPS